MRAIISLLASSLVCVSAFGAELDAALESIAKRAEVPATAVAILRAGEPPRFITFGADAGEHTLFRWGSITKTFTAITLIKTARASNVSLQSPLSDVAGAFDGQGTFAEPVRLIHLAELSAGMSDLTRRAFDDNRAYSLDQALRVHADSLKVRWSPGLHHSYSNATPGLAEWAIERMSGAGYASALAEQVFEPLGMRSASILPDARLPGGYRPDGSEIPYWNMTFKAFGALNASVADLARFAQALLERDPRLGGADLYERLYHPATGLAAAAGLRVGYAAGMYGRVRGGRVWHGHGGDADGYRSRFALLPDAGVGYVVVINSDQPAVLRRMERAIEAELTQGLPKPVAVPVVAPDGLLAYSGRYGPITARWGFESRGSRALDISVTERGVRVGSRQALHVGGGLLRRPDEPVATLALMCHEGIALLVGEMGAYAREGSCEKVK